MKKYSYTKEQLSRVFMDIGLEGRVPPVKTLSKAIGVSVGTVVSVIKEIEEEKGVALQKKGPLGSYIIHLDYEVLWKIGGIKHLICVMPLPYLKRYEGLASGIKDQLKEKIFFGYMRGGNTRLDFVKEGIYQCGITSKEAAREYIKENSELEIIYEFGKDSYLGKHIVLKNTENPKKIGVDFTSRDHQILTNRLFGDKNKYEYVNLSYNELVKAIESKRIDLAIWNLEDLLEKKIDLPYEEIEVDLNMYEGVIVARKENTWLRNYFKDKLNLETLLKHQKQVIEEELVPNY